VLYLNPKNCQVHKERLEHSEHTFDMALSENKQKMLRGELYHSFTPELVGERRRCAQACYRFNNAGDVSRRRLVELWRE
jgi:hypothetical protein